MSFKAKLIGILEVSEARGDRMCQAALADLKMAIRAAGEHKQRITVQISIDGLRLRDEKTGVIKQYPIQIYRLPFFILINKTIISFITKNWNFFQDCQYHHPVHKISFIAQDMSDSRAFGYIFGSPDMGHRFFGIKTDKAASQVNFPQFYHLQNIIHHLIIFNKSVSTISLPGVFICIYQCNRVNRVEVTECY